MIQRMNRMVEIKIIPRMEFQRIKALPIDKYEKLALISDLCRINTLAVIKKAGSGHIGSSFSALDIITLLYHEHLNVLRVGCRHPSRDIFFSSKGHDVPGLYSLLFSLGILPRENFLRLRRFGGLCGHPDISCPGMEANTGSLGMGISKAKGIALAKKKQNLGGRVFVMVGDGELQEGQNFEAFQTAVFQGIGNLTVLVDKNQVQSDRLVSKTVDLGDFSAKMRDFGWEVATCNGHDFSALDRALSELARITDRPKILIAETRKGKGVSFMEAPPSGSGSDSFYRWHSGAPDEESFTAATDELKDRVNLKLKNSGAAPLEWETVPEEEPPSRPLAGENLADVFGEALAGLGAKREDLFVLDADLISDCRLRAFAEKFPDRFIENGIAEQDMVSTAGGLALQGLLPVVNSFAAFLSARACEQIYNNTLERKKTIYVCHYAGLLPAGPGHTHQSLRDIALFSSLPWMTVIQPANTRETIAALDYCVQEAEESCMLRLTLGKTLRKIGGPDDYRFQKGRGSILRRGERAVLFAYGPIMLGEALSAAERLLPKKIPLKVINMPWLNRVDPDWFKSELDGIEHVFVLEDHFTTGGLGDFLMNQLLVLGMMKGRTFEKFGVTGCPAWGKADEVLKHHGLDGESLARRIREVLLPSGR